jgi:hypothetical protein
MLARTGRLPREHLLWAAHLGSHAARLVVDQEQILVNCVYCKARRERYAQDTRGYKQPLPLCNRCNNTTKTKFDGDLIKFVKQVEAVPIRVLVPWACDCAEKAIDRLAPRRTSAGRYRLPNEPERDMLFQNVLVSARRWVKTGEVDPLLYQTSTVGGPGRISRAIVQRDMDGVGRRLRIGLAELVSEAWDGSRAERTWQEGCLIQYLLGYLG